MRELLLQLFAGLLEQGYVTTQPWPWSTDAARLVWQHAQEVAAKEPQLSPERILYRAAEEVNIKGEEMTPEERALIMLAIRWLRSTAAAAKDRPPLKLVPATPTGW